MKIHPVLLRSDGRSGGLKIRIRTILTSVIILEICLLKQSTTDGLLEMGGILENFTSIIFVLALQT